MAILKAENMTQKLKFRFDDNIKLPTKPLIEAWLEIQWRLEDDPDNSKIKRDPEFEFAAFTFYQKVKPEFPRRVIHDNSRIPQDLAPYRIRLQFKKEADEWPLFQLGPGVASVNFSTSYTWTEFNNYAEMLRKHIIASYEKVPEASAFILRYRNAIDFDFANENLLDYLKNNLNLIFRWPDSIPGDSGLSTLPQIVFFAQFVLKDNMGNGRISIQTGTRKESDEEIKAIIIDIEVGTDNPPSLQDKKNYANWLNIAHRICHDWFLSLIEGPLLQQYQGE